MVYKTGLFLDLFLHLDVPFSPEAFTVCNSELSIWNELLRERKVCYFLVLSSPSQTIVSPVLLIELGEMGYLPNAL